MKQETIYHETHFLGNTSFYIRAFIIGCLILPFMSLTNSISAQDCDVNSGVIEAEGSTSLCVNDGEEENLMINVSGSKGTSGWIITDDSGTILGLPQAPPFNFEGVPVGTCVIWHIAYNGELTGLAPEEKIFFIEGCYDLSNPVPVFRYDTPNGGTISTTDGLTEFSICALDGEPDPFTVEVDGSNGQNAAWVITDSDLNILGLPEGPTFDLDGAGAGTCLVWYLRYNGELVGAELGANARDLSGCYDLSNPITVNRSIAEAAAIETTDGLTEFSICVDETPDPFTVEVSGGSGDNSLWVITDQDLNILATPEGPTFDLNGAGVGTCLVWYLNYADDVNLDITNAADLEGCFALSNPITVYRTTAEAAEIKTTDGENELTICADGTPDPFTVVVDGGSGDNALWVITDQDLNILGLPEGPTFDLDGAGAGTCLVWYLTYADGTNLDITNAGDLEGCFALSNPITVVRNVAEAASIKTTDGETEFSICVDETPDPFTVEVSGGSGDNSLWVITDQDLNILATPEGPTFDLNGAGVGTCLVWYLNYADDVNLDITNAADLEGCFALSNPITVYRTTAEAAEIKTTDGETDLTICADGTPDPFTVIVDGGTGDNSLWVITDEALNILATPEGPTFDLDGAGAGTCLVWYLTYADGVNLDITNAGDLEGCFALSNPITVVRNVAEAAAIKTTDGLTEFSICVDETPDPFTVEVSGGSGDNSLWVITDQDLNILATPEGPTFDLNGAGVGTCLVWYLNYADDVNLDITNAADLEGCFALSNPITVYRTAAEAAEIKTTDGETELTICADGTPDPFTVVVDGGSGDNALWVITDQDLNILGLPEGPTFDLDGAGAGTCLVWYLTYADGTNLDITNAGDLEGCFALSNPITVVRNVAEAAAIKTTDGLTEFSICVDETPDPFTVEASGGSGDNSLWVITDQDLNILATPEGPTFDLNGAGVGTCLVWYLNYADDVNLDITNAADLEGCFALSNPITVYRTTAEAAEIKTTDGETDLTICADGTPDPFTVEVSGGSGDNSLWVITDQDLNILGLPEGPTFDLDGAGAGTCLVWYLTYADGVNLDITNAGDLEGCFALSNPITVHRLSGSDCEENCVAPDDVQVVMIRKNKAYLDWSNVPNAFFYYVRFRAVGSSKWSYGFTQQSKATLKSLKKSTKYEVQVISYCGSGEFSSWSDVFYFTTPSSNISNLTIDNSESEILDFENTSLDIFPNPVISTLNVDTNLKGEKVKIAIYSMSGDLVHSQEFSNNEFTSINMENLSPGTYIFNIQDGEEQVSKTFIKQ